MAGSGALETVEDARIRARRRLPRQVYMALWAGSQAGVTLRENVRAFSRIYVRTRVGNAPKDLHTATTLMGQELSLPVILSPAGAQGICPRADVAAARGAATAGTAMGLSAFANDPIEAVVAANPQTFAQVFWLGRERVAAQIERARLAGARGLIITLDWSFPEGRDWGSPYIPERMTPRTMARYAPQALLHPAWLAGFVRDQRLPTLEAPNMARTDNPHPGFFEAYVEWMQVPAPGWDDVAWLRDQWAGHLMVKGVLDPEDARRAVDSGADAISVSNHGGNNMDGAIPSIAALPAVVGAVGDQVEVVQDGGVRRGSDVVKSLALGARAVMVGRPYLWALAARGETGVAEVLEVLRKGIRQTLTEMGVASVSDVERSHIIVPEHFYDEQDPGAAWCADGGPPRSRWA